MLSLTAPQMAEVSRLWDEALALDGPQRRSWLEQLQHVDPPVRLSLERLCSTPAPSPDDSFMRAVPILELMPDAQDTAALQSGDTVGPYRLETELGRGGMGVVWNASRADGLMTRTVALKLPHPWLASPQVLQRFARERDILASLSHPHIARLYDAGITPRGQPYFALELVEGLPITTYCTAHALDIDQRIALFLQVLDAVQYAHEHQVVHRDLKPANILVSSDGQAHLLDFGIAKLLDDPDAIALTQLGATGWTPAYASPEQIAGATVSAQSDVYALGVLFYELMSGQRPYSVNRPTRAAIEEAILSAEVVPPSIAVQCLRGSPKTRHAACKLKRRLRGDLDVIVLTALQRPLARRFANARAFADDLRRHQAGERVISRPDSRTRRVQRFLYRYRVFASATALVVAGLGASLVLAWNAAERARDHERTAEAALSFMQDLFKANEIDLASPRKPGDRTARELLDVGARRIDESLKDAPRVKVRIYGSLSRMYQQLALTAEAREVSRKWVALARSRTDEDPRELVDALIAFGRSSEDPYNKELLAAIVEAEAILKRLASSAPEDRWRLGNAQSLHGLLLIPSDRAQARQLMQHAIDLLADSPDKAGYAQALLFQAEDFNRSHNPEPALRLVEKILPTVPVNSPSHLNALEARCAARVQLGDLQGGVDDCRAVWDAIIRAYGADARWPAYLTPVLGSFYVRASQPIEAVTLMSGEVNALTASNRPDTVMALMLLYARLAEAEIARGRLADAQVWVARMQTLEREHRDEVADVIRVPQVAATAALLVEQGRDEAAETQINLGLKYAQSSGFDAVLETRKLRHLAVRIALDRRQLSQAQALFNEANARYESPPDVTPSPLGPDALDRTLLGLELAFEQGRLDAAKVSGDLIRQQIQASAHPTVFEMHLRQVEILLGLVDVRRERPDEALTHFERAAALGVTWIDRDSLGNVPLWVGRGLAQAQLRRWNDAAHSERRARAIVDHHGEASERYTRLLADLTQAVDAQHETRAGP